MRVRFYFDSLIRTVEVDSWQASTSLRELIADIGGPLLDDSAEVYVDSERYLAQTLLDDVILVEGARIARAPLPSAQEFSGWSVTLVGGVSSGFVLPFSQGRPLIFGRSPQADLVLDTESASWEHFTAELIDGEVHLRDSGSTNGTLLDGEKLGSEPVVRAASFSVQAGGVVLLFRPSLDEVKAPKPGSLRNLTPGFTAPYNRPPRQALPSLAQEVVLPKRQEVTSSSRFNLAMLLSPLAMAAAMVLMMGNIRFAVFALLSPLMMVGNWLEQKYRYSKDLKAEEERFSQALADFRDDLAARNSYELGRKNELVPDIGLLERRVTLPTTELWKRRDSSADFLLTRVATGSVPWCPPLESRSASGKIDDAVQALLDSNNLHNCPIIGNLNNAGVIGIVGDRQGALALARNIALQVAVNVGPADTTMGVFFDLGKEDDWAWTSWLPHTRQAGSATGGRWIASGKDDSSAMLHTLKQGLDGFITPSLFLVLDSEVLTEGRDAPARILLGNGRGEEKKPGLSLGRSAAKDSLLVSGVVVAASEEQLPAACTTVVRVSSDADAEVFLPQTRELFKDAVISGSSREQAERLAMALAHFDDPELKIPGAALPRLVQMPKLLGLAQPSSESVQRLWAADSGVSTPVGIGDQGEYLLDLVKDGPHGLVGGTTGSGKSEFLRTLVAGLAARNSPDELNFILIDFKGGAAFKACERFPHTIGTISNLDAQLADRALRALDAEMERRQRLFAQAGEGVDNIKDYLATNPAEPLPRILLVIDEFAMLAKDFPDVLQSLVSVAAVGRTLGVHMILATQRPAGVVNNDILANTNLRVALRVQSSEDSNNVIGVPDAASISRSQMGRAYIKLGQEDISAVQTALVTGQSESSLENRLELRESSVFGVPLAPLHEVTKVRALDSDLDVLIDAVCQAQADLGLSLPRQVWPEALGDRVALKNFSADVVTELGKVRQPVGSFEDGRLLVALADQPQLQRQVTAGWDIEKGNILLLGVPGSGTTTTLASFALVAAFASAPSDLNIAVLDMGAGDLAALKGLPHTIAYVGSGDRAKEERARFMRFLVKELDRRRAALGPQPKLLVLVDGLANLREEYNDFDGQALLQFLYRAYAEGTPLGIHFAVSSARMRAVAAQVSDVTSQRWVYKLGEQYDYSSVGVKGKDVPAEVPGRCVQVGVLEQMHVATPDCSLDEAVLRVLGRWPDAVRGLDVIGKLPDRVSVEALGVLPLVGAEPWRIPIGLSEQDLEPAYLEVYEGEHIMVAGPARSGKSDTLLALAESFGKVQDASGNAVSLWAICGRRSPLAQAGFEHLAVGEEEVPALLAQLRLSPGPSVLFIDDSDTFADADKSISGLLDKPQPGLLIVAAGRSDELRSLYNHWTKTLRKSKCGVLLQPNVDFDGDILGAKIPRKAPVELSAGRGYAVSNGAVQLVQTISATA